MENCREATRQKLHLSWPRSYRDSSRPSKKKTSVSEARSSTGNKWVTVYKVKFKAFDEAFLLSTVEQVRERIINVNSAFYRAFTFFFISQTSSAFVGLNINFNKTMIMGSSAIIVSVLLVSVVGNSTIYKDIKEKL
nr:unnamed protein product [Callosobruchus analis]